MKALTFPLIAALALATACTGDAYMPILDGPPSASFQDDLAACRTLARNQRQFGQETTAAAVLGAGAGALIGSLDDDGDALGGAVVGALAGGTASAVDMRDRRKAIVITCLQGRGHAVVG